MFPPTKREIAAAIACTIDHLQHPEVPYVEYRRRAFEQLETMHRHRLLIYLDTKYWVWLRQPSLAGKNENAVRRLFDLLRDGIIDGRFLCPVSFPTAGELYRQPDDIRLATASIMDELSLGVSLKAPHEIDLVEWISLFRQVANLGGLPLAEPVWTKVGLLFAERILEAELLGANLAGQKRAFHSFWIRPVSEVSLMAPQVMGLPDFGARINQERAQKPRGDFDYNQLCFIELYTAVDQKRGTVVKALSAIASGGVTNLDPPPEEMWEQFLREMCQATKDVSTGQRLPYQRTVAAVHASIRMNDANLHETNDLADAMHAGGALAYCDVFLTERSLAKRIQTDVINQIPTECEVEYLPDAAVACRTISGINQRRFS